MDIYEKLAVADFMAYHNRLARNLDEDEFFAECKAAADIQGFDLPGQAQHYRNMQLLSGTKIAKKMQQVDCPECNGTGQWPGAFLLHECKKCAGTGKIMQEVEEKFGRMNNTRVKTPF